MKFQVFKTHNSVDHVFSLSISWLRIKSLFLSNSPQDVSVVISLVISFTKFYLFIAEIESEYMGCFYNDNYVTEVHIQLTAPNRTMSICRSACKHGGFRYAGNYQPRTKNKER